MSLAQISGWPSGSEPSNRARRRRSPPTVQPCAPGAPPSDRARIARPLSCLSWFPTSDSASAFRVFRGPLPQFLLDFPPSFAPFASFAGTHRSLPFVFFVSFVVPHLRFRLRPPCIPWAIASVSFGFPSVIRLFRTIRGHPSVPSFRVFRVFRGSHLRFRLRLPCVPCIPWAIVSVSFGFPSVIRPIRMIRGQSPTMHSALSSLHSPLRRLHSRLRRLHGPLNFFAGLCAACTAR